jgi:hypothetical protein
MRADAESVLERYDAGDDNVEDRDLVEARVVQWSLEDLESPERALF